MTTWSVKPETVQTALTTAGGIYDGVAEQLYGSTAVKGTAGVASWETRYQDLAGASGSDGIVANAFSTFITDQLTTVDSALDRFGKVMNATYEAAAALIKGDEASAQAIATSAASALDKAPGVP